MYFFGLSKEQVLSQKHVVSYNETSNENPISMVTLFGRQVFPVKSERNPKNVIDLEELPTTEHADSVSYVTTVRNLETKPKTDQSLAEDHSESCLLDLNRIPDDEVSEPHYCFLQDLNCPYIEETSCEKSGIDDGPMLSCSHHVHEKDGTSSPASCTSCCTTENNPRTESPVPSCSTGLEFPVREVLPVNRCCNEEEPLSEMIQMAAESLVHISVVSYQNQDLQSSQDQEPTCCSCDSYELQTLGINETNTEEDLCVSSMVINKVNNITRDDKKEIGVKLRRGRRMKNFQKEILPSLTSLSRHEIREDINILVAVLRSREYKKMQGKTKDVKFGANPRNKHKYVGKTRR